MTDTTAKIAQFKKMRDSEIEADINAGVTDATMRGWATYATRVELHCQATASRLASAEKRLKKIADADATSKLDPDCVFGHTYNDVEYQTTADSDDYVSVFVGGVDVTDVIGDRFKSVAESAHFWAAENAGRESHEQARIDRFIERRDALMDSLGFPSIRGQA
jgi:hypothetical protein